MMKILQVIAPGSVFEITDVPIPVPGAGEALVRIEAITTCPQWDLHLRHNEPMCIGTLIRCSTGRVTYWA